MSPELVFYAGIAVSLVAVAIAIVAILVLRFSKVRLNKQLDAEYGKRRP